MTKLLLAVPTHNRQVFGDFLVSSIDTALACDKRGIHMDVSICAGHAYLDLARDVLLHGFLKSDFTHMLQLDADLGWNGEDVVKLIDHDLPIVAGVFPQRKETPEFVVHLNGKQKGQLLGVDGSPGGFTLIRRDAVERMIEHFPDLTVTGVREYPGEEVHCLHASGVYDGHHWGEDMIFCRRAREAGLELWVDPKLNFRHWDGSKCFAHRFMDTLIARGYVKVTNVSQG